jgi:hypothetical protein
MHCSKIVDIERFKGCSSFLLQHYSIFVCAFISECAEVEAERSAERMKQHQATSIYGRENTAAADCILGADDVDEPAASVLPIRGQSVVHRSPPAQACGSQTDLPSRHPCRHADDGHIGGGVVREGHRTGTEAAYMA